jgi:hypothetical protein
VLRALWWKPTGSGGSVGPENAAAHESQMSAASSAGLPLRTVGAVRFGRPYGGKEVEDGVEVHEVPVIHVDGVQGEVGHEFLQYCFTVDCFRCRNWWRGKTAAAGRIAGAGRIVGGLLDLRRAMTGERVRTMPLCGGVVATSSTKLSKVR